MPAELMACLLQRNTVPPRTARRLFFPHRLIGEGQLPHSAESFIAGATAGGIATGVTHPLDLLRTRFAAQGNERVREESEACASPRYGGMRGYAVIPGASDRGLGQIVPSMGMFFAGYETLRLPLGNLDLPFGSGGAVAGRGGVGDRQDGHFPARFGAEEDSSPGPDEKQIRPQEYARVRRCLSKHFV